MTHQTKLSFWLIFTQPRGRGLPLSQFLYFSSKQTVFSPPLEIFYNFNLFHFMAFSELIESEFLNFTLEFDERQFLSFECI